MRPTDGPGSAPFDPISCSSISAGPGGDGADLCRAVKAAPETHSTRILAMGRPREDEARQRLLAAGADGFLPKPFTLSQLEAEVARLT